MMHNVEYLYYWPDSGSRLLTAPKFWRPLNIKNFANDGQVYNFITQPQFSSRALPAYNKSSSAAIIQPEYIFVEDTLFNFSYKIVMPFMKLLWNYFFSKKILENLIS